MVDVNIHYLLGLTNNLSGLPSPMNEHCVSLIQELALGRFESALFYARALDPLLETIINGLATKRGNFGFGAMNDVETLDIYRIVQKILSKINGR